MTRKTRFQRSVSAEIGLRGSTRHSACRRVRLCAHFGCSIAKVEDDLLNDSGAGIVGELLGGIAGIALVAGVSDLMTDDASAAAGRLRPHPGLLKRDSDLRDDTDPDSVVDFVCCLLQR